MRPAFRLLATVQRSGSQYLEAGAPTGLTGLLTHASPRTTLLYLYNDTLEKLKQFPEHSVYRQSTEALTKHRMRIVESVKPQGLKEWQQRVMPVVEANSSAFKTIPVTTSDGEKAVNIIWKAGAYLGQSDPEDNLEYKGRAPLEGPRTLSERESQGKQLSYDQIGHHTSIPEIEPEPPLTASQIGEIEQQIGAGLVEEVIQVAEGERELAQVLLDNKVWEDLEEKPPAGQWVGHERADRHTGTTQKP
ncbi:NADH-ubiquinone oxidoreductase [Cercospora beticola]|uniref:NADH-ubiquinone oxidoreductase n=1 Tax=Cercospora beticola TaxID=122368 RepID=A0A2G5HJS7_CERBT|nr:NADH-ubiquinone oxidoreductase [Cercospora beticola]PIA92814.1 NADH-ubiquinone oxidoreductase [Cercospora beticola]WPB01100.1 hypothetical protein RHO25_005720 [Cercospora beticola]CAK1364155.1 unnamed protein product [Cercospora beticola]